MNGALGISMDRLGSGTTWIPDAVKLPARHYLAGSWMFMVHGFGFLQYDWQQVPRGDTQFGGSGPQLHRRAGQHRRSLARLRARDLARIRDDARGRWTWHGQRHSSRTGARLWVARADRCDGVS